MTKLDNLAASKDPETSAKSAKHPRSLTPLLVLTGILVLVIGVAVSLFVWHSNYLTKKAVAQSTTSKNNILNLNTDQSAPSTVKPTQNTYNNYKVPPDEPLHILIPKIGVKANVESLGLTSDNEIETPGSIYDAGWYNGSSKPGQPGAVLIDGHVADFSIQGVFGDLHSLTAGDQIQIELGNGTVINYQVVKTQAYDVNDVDMNAALQPIDPSSPGLNLITCTGSVIPGTNVYSQRLVIFAKQTST